MTVPAPERFCANKCAVDGYERRDRLSPRRYLSNGATVAEAQPLFTVYAKIIGAHTIKQGRSGRYGRCLCSSPDESPAYTRVVICGYRSRKCRQAESFG